MTNPRSAKNLTVADAIGTFGKVARRRDLLDMGLSIKQLDQAVKSGQILKVARGHYGLRWAEAEDVILARN